MKNLAEFLILLPISLISGLAYYTRDEPAWDTTKCLAVPQEEQRVRMTHDGECAMQHAIAGRGCSIRQEMVVTERKVRYECEVGAVYGWQEVSRRPRTEEDVLRQIG